MMIARSVGLDRVENFDILSQKVYSPASIELPAVFIVNMSKRANDQGEERAAKQLRQANDGQPTQKADDEGMGEFEDQWGDEEESDGEVIEHDIAEDDDVNGDEDSKFFEAAYGSTLHGIYWTRTPDVQSR